MSALAFLIPTSLVLGAVGLGCFLWSLGSRQYEDLDGAAERILLDDETEGPVVDQVRTTQIR
jgi:cbb3-type cytochrome oxidase maturation protein